MIRYARVRVSVSAVCGTHAAPHSTIRRKVSPCVSPEEVTLKKDVKLFNKNIFLFSKLKTGNLVKHA